MEKYPRKAPLDEATPHKTHKSGRGKFRRKMHKNK